MRACNSIKRYFTRSVAKVTEKSAVYQKFHGRLRVDEYNTIRYSKKEQNRIIARENEIYRQWIDHIQPNYVKWYRKVMARRTLSHAAPTEEYTSSTFYTKIADNEANSLIFCRKKGEQEEILFDLRELSWINDFNKAYTDTIRISPDQVYLAFLVDTENNEQFDAGIKNLETKQILVSAAIIQDLRIKGCASAEFSQDSKSLYFVEMNELRRPFRLKKRAIQGDEEVVLYEEKNPKMYLSAQLSKDKKYIIVKSQSWEDSVVFVIPQEENLKDQLIPIVALEDKILMTIDHVRDVFVAVSNKDQAKNMKVSVLKDQYLSEPSRRKMLTLFEDIIVPEQREIITEFDIFKDYVAAYVSKCGRSKIFKYSFEEQKTYEIELRGETTIPKEDGGLGVVQPGINLDYETSKLYYYFSSLLQFETQYELDLDQNKVKLRQKAQMKGPRIRRNNYTFKQIVAPAHDGEEIPITIIHPKHINLDHKNKLLIDGYGAYGTPADLNFHVTHLAAVDNEWIVAYPHVRGGNDKGKQWHQDGKLLNKANSIRDFISASQFLISEGYSHPNYVAAVGSSAGGLLVGASVNLKPELFRACVLNVPFLDIVSILADQSLPLSQTDYPEFGNPNQRADIFDCQMSYSPFENIQPQEYPAMLINLSLDDPRIPTWSVLKYVEKLRDVAQTPTRMPQFVKGSKNIALRVLTKGHLGSANNKLNLEDSAWDLAWLDSMLFKAKKSWLF